MPVRNLRKLFTALTAVVAMSLPLQAGADEADRLLRGIVNGVLDEYLPQEQRRYDRRYDDDRRFRGGVTIPPGHYPPPGACRVWYPDRPPGHQPPPTSCNVRVPRGAFLVRG